VRVGYYPEIGDGAVSMDVGITWHECQDLLHWDSQGKGQSHSEAGECISAEALLQWCALSISTRILRGRQAIDQVLLQRQTAWKNEGGCVCHDASSGIGVLV